MSNILLYPMEDKYNTKLTQEYDGVSLGSIFVQETPTFTLPSGTKFCIVLSPNTSIQQAVIVDGFNSGAKTLNVSDASINKGPGLAYTQSTHPVGAEVIITDNFAHWEEIVSAVNSKLDQTGGTVSSFSLGVTGSNWRIRKDGSDMKFRDDNQSEVTLSTIASSGSDEKTKVSVSDTTSGYLDGKLTAGDGLSKTKVNSGSNESLDFDIDLTDTAIFSTTQVSSKVPLLNGSGRVTPFINGQSDGSATNSDKGLNKIATDSVASTGTDEYDTINSKQLNTIPVTKSNVGSFTRAEDGATGSVSYAHGLGKTPKSISFRWTNSGGETLLSVGGGFYANGSNVCTYNTSIDSTKCIKTANQSGSVTSVDSTNFTISWTLISSDTDTIRVIRQADA